MGAILYAYNNDADGCKVSWTDTKCSPAGRAAEAAASQHWQSEDGAGSSVHGLRHTHASLLVVAGGVRRQRGQKVGVFKYDDVRIDDGEEPNALLCNYWGRNPVGKPR